MTPQEDATTIFHDGPAEITIWNPAIGNSGYWLDVSEDGFIRIDPARARAIAAALTAWADAQEAGQ